MENAEASAATPSAPVTPPPYKSGDPITVKLSAPIKTHKGELQELTLTVPKMRAFRLYGEMLRQTLITPTGPQRGPATEQRTESAYNFDAVVGYLSESTGISAIELDGLDGRDVEYLANTMIVMIRTRAADPKS